MSAILYLNRSLFIEVFVSLRAVAISWDVDTLYLYFFCDGEISEDDQYSAECIGTEVIANFSDAQLSENILRWDFPKPIPQDKGIIVYWRQEPFIEEQNVKLPTRITLSLNRALIRKVPPSLREVAFKVHEKNIDIYVIFHGEISDYNCKLADFLAFSLSIDFPDCTIALHAERIDGPKRIQLDIPFGEGSVVYARKEPCQPKTG